MVYGRFHCKIHKLFHHDLYAVHDLYTVYDLNGKSVGFNSCLPHSNEESLESTGTESEDFSEKEKCSRWMLTMWDF